MEDEIKTPKPKSNKATNMKLYPNPAHASFSLDDGDSKKQALDVEIYTLHGQKVGGGKIKEGENIAINSLLNGAYIIKYTDSKDNVSTKKLIKN